MGPDVVAPAGVEVVRRWADDGATGAATSWLFAINHTDADATLGTADAPVAGTELLSGDTVEGSLTVPAGAVRVVRVDG